MLILVSHELSNVCELTGSLELSRNTRTPCLSEKLSTTGRFKKVARGNQLNPSTIPIKLDPLWFSWRNPLREEASFSLSLEGVTLKLDGLDDALFDHNMN